MIAYITKEAVIGTRAQQSKPELRVLQVFSALGMGGAETWLISLLRYFHKARHSLPIKVQFDVLLTGGAKDVFDEEAMALGAQLFYVPFTRRNIAGFSRQVCTILANGNYHAIHDHQDYISGWHFMLGRSYLPRTRVAHVHNPLYHRNNYAHGWLRQITQSLGKQMIAQFATHVMGTSRQIVTEYGFDGLAARQIVLGAAHCGFDVTRYQGNRNQQHAALCQELGWAEESKLLLFVGRLEGSEFMHLGQRMTHKNPGLALEITRACIARDERVRLVMVGAGDEKRKEFEARAQSWGLAPKIRFLGTRSDVPRLMLGSDLLLFPSLAEGLGMVVVEAQAAGLPVLASDTTPPECVVVSDLVKFQSLATSPTQWAAQALQLLQRNYAAAAVYNQAVRDSAFSIENSAARLLDIYSADQWRQGLTNERQRAFAH